MLRSIFMLFGCILIGSIQTQAQNSFPEQCIGNWQGTLFIYKQGQLRDSIPVQLEVARTGDPVAFQWKTTYMSENHPMTKDYQLIADPSRPNAFIMKEDEQIELYMYKFDNKLYSLFETEGTMLSSTYELKKDTLFFEVNSASIQASGPLVNSFNIDYLQKVRFVRVQQ